MLMRYLTIKGYVNISSCLMFGYFSEKNLGVFLLNEFVIFKIVDTIQKMDFNSPVPNFSPRFHLKKVNANILQAQ